MSKRLKVLEKMRTNPCGWHIEDLKKIAQDYEMTIRQPGTSHVTFTKKGSGLRLTVPSHKPIKPIYIKQFMALIAKIEKEEDL
jgi:hypothetical protein